MMKSLLVLVVVLVLIAVAYAQQPTAQIPYLNGVFFLQASRDNERHAYVSGVLDTLLITIENEPDVRNGAKCVRRHEPFLTATEMAEFTSIYLANHKEDRKILSASAATIVLAVLNAFCPSIR